jgi:hypothetical protein
MRFMVNMQLILQTNINYLNNLNLEIQIQTLIMLYIYIIVINLHGFLNIAHFNLHSI